MGDENVRRVFVCCYGEGAHTARCVVPKVPDVITPEVAAAALMALAVAYDNGQGPNRNWLDALETAAECGRKLARAKATMTEEERSA